MSSLNRALMFQNHRSKKDMSIDILLLILTCGLLVPAFLAAHSSSKVDAEALSERASVWNIRLFLIVLVLTVLTVGIFPLRRVFQAENDSQPGAPKSKKKDKDDGVISGRSLERPPAKVTFSPMVQKASYLPDEKPGVIYDPHNSWLSSHDANTAGRKHVGHWHRKGSVDSTFRPA